MRVIFHVDVNNAYLSWTAVYLLKNGYKKDIRLIPSVIGGDEDSRHGIVLAKSPVAKKLGVKSAETIYMARKKCKDLEVYPPDFSIYEEYSNKFYNYLKQYSPLIERASVDECFLDMSNTKYLYDDLEKLAYKIKDDIKNMFGFTVNVGIGNNKLLAKMASDFEKPDKVHTLYTSEIETKMWPLDVSDLLFVGKSSSKLLHSIGIDTIGDLANCDPALLSKYYKSRVDDLINSAKGIDDSPVVNDYGDNKSISISRTLMKDTDNLNEIKKILLKLSQEIGLRARNSHLYANTIAITVRTSSFKNISHQLTLDSSTNNTMEIYEKVCELLRDIDKSESFRLLGIRLDNLTKNKTSKVSFFEEEDNDDIQKIMDNLNTKYKNSIIMPAIFYKGDK
jgi:DNA polymerase-4